MGTRKALPQSMEDICKEQKSDNIINVEESTISLHGTYTHNDDDNRQSHEQAKGDSDNHTVVVKG